MSAHQKHTWKIHQHVPSPSCAGDAIPNSVLNTALPYAQAHAKTTIFYVYWLWLLTRT
jgi:hypothetical protein